MLSTEQQKKIERLQKVVEGGGQTKDVILFDSLIEELSNYFDVSTQTIVDAINKLQEAKEKEPVINVESPTVNVPAPVVNIAPPQVNVDAPIVSIDTESVSKPLQEILTQIQNQEPFNLENALSKFIKEDRIKVSVDRVGGMGGVVTSPIVDALNNQNRDQTPLAMQVDDVSTSGVTYIGKARVGSSTSASVWSIQKIDQTGTPITTTIKWANSGAYTSIWANRTSLTYN